MKNITVSVDDEVYRRARVKAAERDTSVSALVRQFLIDLTQEGSEFERLERLEKVLRERITDFDGSNRLSRDEVHERRRWSRFPVQEISLD
ncbi:MAG: ribbon-helix-helix protein, CopG family, partial [Proteobacteria bacterium]|nr:ribbon-helix-helix protein, CopG family [Pseudomonadota bacterium]